MPARSHPVGAEDLKSEPLARQPPARSGTATPICALSTIVDMRFLLVASGRHYRAAADTNAKRYGRTSHAAGSTPF